MKLFHPLHLTPDLVHSLASDLSSMRKGFYPAHHQLESGVLIEDWEISYFRASVLKGKLIDRENHELCNDISSYIWAFDKDDRWARTTGAIYRLGTPKVHQRVRAGQAFRALLEGGGEYS
ncbi:MAG: hypothetical protein K2X54_31235 [Methylobacterium organophilum]|nr:hypothetical protein [Methylobacterium organophilum]